MNDVSECLPNRISRRGNSYSLSRNIGGKKHCYYSESLDQLIEYDKLMDKGIIPDKYYHVKHHPTEEGLNKMIGTEDERWKWIKGFEGLYAVSDKGNVMSFHHNKYGKLMHPTQNNGWYKSITLRGLDGTTRYTRVHILVAEAFIGCILPKHQIHHKDGNKQNNCVENIKIVSCSEHFRETLKQYPHLLDGMISYNKGRYTGKYKWYVRSGEEPREVKHRLKKGKIIQLSTKGDVLAIFNNSMDAQRATGVCYRNILQVANKTPYGKNARIRKQAGGFRWVFEMDYGMEVMRNEDSNISNGQ